MDRTIWQVGELLRAEDLLGAVKNAYIAIGHLAEATIGSNVGVNVNGFQISATTPTANMQVTIGRGSIYSTQTIDGTAYGVLGTDTTTIVKQGILSTPVTLTVTAPGTVGYSQYYLVEVGFNETDTNAVVLPYYNAASTTTPLNGPSGGGGSNYTVRSDQAVVQLKAGTAAATGSQTVPSPDAGFNPLWVILVSNGTTQITGAGTSAGQWYAYPNAATFPNLESLRSLFILQVPSTTYYVNSSTGNDTSGDGSAANPWLTIQKAINVLSTYNFASQSVTIQLQNTGTFAGPVITNAAFGGTLIIRGNPAAQSSYTISGNAPTYGGLVSISGGASVSLIGLTLSCQNTGIVQNLIVGQSTCSVQNVTFAGVTGTLALMSASVSGNINILAGCIFGQSATYCMQSVNASAIIFLANASTSGAPAWGAACAFSSNGSTIALGGAGGWTFTNTGATGVRYVAAVNGVINTNGAGANFFPGNSAGSTASGGQYV